jgi:hypothetical protein
MATNENEEPAAVNRRDEVVAMLTTGVQRVTDTDRTMPLRAFVLLIVIGLCVSFAPAPASYLGVVATIALAISAPARQRQR